MEKYPTRNVALLAYNAWEIWKRRNTHRWLEDEQSRERGTLNETKPQLQHKWSRPERGLYKLNTDIAVGSDGAVGLGFVLRDCSGSMVLAGKSTCRATGSSTVLEGMAIRYALQMVEQYRLQASHMDLYARQVVQDIKWLMERVECKECRYFPRQVNMTAHHIAHGPDFISIHHTPNHIICFLQRDVINRLIYGLMKEGFPLKKLKKKTTHKNSP